MLSKNARRYLETGVASYQYGVEIANAIDAAGAPQPPYQVATLHITSAQILSLTRNTPITLLPPVGNSAYAVAYVDWNYNFVTTPYTISGGFGASLAVSTSINNYDLNFITATGFLDQTSNQEQFLGLHSTPQQLGRSEGLVLGTGLGSSFSVGDGTLTIKIYYNLLT